MLEVLVCDFRRVDMIEVKRRSDRDPVTFEVVVRGEKSERSAGAVAAARRDD
jgi:hypothetical protein